MVAFPWRGDGVIRPNNVPDFIGALLFMAIGIVVSLEAYRLQAYSQSQYVGDHTLPAILGILFVVLGGVLLLQSFRALKETKTRKPVSNNSSVQLRMLLCFASLFVYTWLMNAVGYLLATWIVSFALFCLIGSYRIGMAMFFALLLTGCLYVVFILWLQITFPTGFLG
jgi:putative tricarboxylic transport membrane protein